MGNPDADTIARAIIAAARVADIDPIDLATFQVKGGAVKEIAAARAGVAFALDQHWGRSAAWWRVHLGWAKTSNAAHVSIHTGRKAGHDRGSARIAAQAVLGIPTLPEPLPPAPASKPIVQAKPVEKKSLARQRPVVPPVPSLQRRLVNAKPRPEKTPKKVMTSDEWKETKVSALSAPAPAVTPDDEMIANAKPFEALHSVYELRMVQRAQRLRGGGESLAAIKQALKAEMAVIQSINWIASACATDLSKFDEAA